MKLFLKMYKLREVQISQNRPDNPSAASQPRGQTPHGRAREVRCVTRRRPAAVSSTARAYTLRPAARPLEDRRRRCHAAAQSYTAVAHRSASPRLAYGQAIATCPSNNASLVRDWCCSLVSRLLFPSLMVVKQPVARPYPATRRYWIN